MMQKPATKKPNRKRRAAILVMTLWITVILGMISSSLLYDVYLEMKITKFHRDDFEAMTLARAGLARAIVDLQNDKILDLKGRNQPVDAMGDVWADFEDEENKINIPMGNREDGKYTVWIEDESSRFNLNMADKNLLKMVFLELEYDEEEATALAASITDYRDPDDNTELPGTGKEDEYYSGAIVESSGRSRRDGEPLVYRCKNDQFTSVEELLSVYGVTPEMYYGVDLEEEIVPDPIAHLKEKVENLRHESRRKKKPGLRDIFTVHSDGMININTVDPFVLEVMMRLVVGDPNSAEKLAESVLDLRKKNARGRATNENALRDVQDLVRLAGMPPLHARRLSDLVRLSVTSDVFRVSALGQIGDSEHMIVATIRRNYEPYDPAQISVYVEQGRVGEQFLNAFAQRWSDREENIENVSIRVIQWHEL
jgi:type II secretory pathway component PulK